VPFLVAVCIPSAQVARRGLGDVLLHGAANVADGVSAAASSAARGGEPAAWSTTAGGVSDTRDITRNVERVGHLDDPTQASG
jgi:hypothetical protein